MRVRLREASAWWLAVAAGGSAALLLFLSKAAVGGPQEPVFDGDAQLASFAAPPGPWFLAFVGLALAGVGVWWVRRRRRRALQVVAASWLADTAHEMCVRMERDIQSGEWDRAIRDCGAAVRARIERHKVEVAARVESQIDGDFFMAALKASIADMPMVDGQQWKEEFNAIANPRLAAIIDLPTLESDLRDLTCSTTESLVARWTPVERKPPEQLESIAPDRLRQLIGLPSDLGEQLLSGSIFGAAALGGTLLGAMSLGFGFNMMGLALKIANSDLFVGFVVDMVFDFVVETVGEEFLEEAAEALVALFTGLGALFTLYKVGKYGWKLKKLVVDKEPLVRVRAQIVNQAWQQLDELADSLDSRIPVQLTERRNALLAELQTVQNECRDLVRVAAA